MASDGVVPKGNEDWRDQIRLEIQNEIERQVRMALDTPPLERLKRNSEKARVQQTDSEFDAYESDWEANGSFLSHSAINGNSHPRKTNVPTWDDYSANRYSSDSRIKMWQMHRRLNAHVEAVINDARKRPNGARKLFANLDGINASQNDEPTSQPQLDYSRTPSKYRTFVNPPSKSEGAIQLHVKAAAAKGPKASSATDAADNANASASANSATVVFPYDLVALRQAGQTAFRNFGSLSAKEKQLVFYNFTKHAFPLILRAKKLPDGSDVEILSTGMQSQSVIKDRYGIIRDQHGPFWPKECGPLHATPVHRRFANDKNTKPEPLLTSEVANNHGGNFNANTNGDTLWYSGIVVYDVEKSNRDCTPTNCAPTIGNPEVDQRLRDLTPPLWFESRFECGNLRQARRIGERTYQLVLNTDFNTTRHTQWYYFRVRNAVPGLTYRFIFVNLMKPTSLYSHGMRPLLYSEKRVEKEQVGWYRCGHHISYSKNFLHRECPLLPHDEDFYQLDFCLEFPYKNDSCYVAHCYPYGFTDLKSDLELLLAEPSRAACMKRTVLCETLAGNACFLLTITNFSTGEDITSAPTASETELAALKTRNKKVAFISGRVHPGETNASWMMKGLIDYLSGDDPVAARLRDSIIFKIVPMLNPDGVIIGNYRCALLGRDLNRNYRHPKEHRFPTVWHIKELVRQLSRDHQVILYCDLHGHSRKSGAFLYGCDSIYSKEDDLNFAERRGKQGSPECFLEERLFPWLMAAQANDDLFSFNGCKYGIRRCKEATGRVVMWRQFGIDRSFTLEVSFSGTESGNGARHFRVKDLETIGIKLAKAIDNYTTILSEEALLHAVYANMMAYYVNIGQLTLGSTAKQEDRESLKSESLTDKQPLPAVTLQVTDMSALTHRPIQELYERFAELLTHRVVAEDDESDCDSNSDAEKETEALSDSESVATVQHAEKVAQTSVSLPKKSLKEPKTVKREAKKVVFPTPTETSTKNAKVSRTRSSAGLPKSKSIIFEKQTTQDSVQFASTPAQPSSASVSVEEGAQKKPVRAKDREGTPNAGIPYFALKRALDRSEVKLEKLREKFDCDPEKMEAAQTEYLKQITQVRKRLSELSNLLPSFSTPLTLWMDDDNNDYDRQREQRQVLIRSILFEPDSAILTAKPTVAKLPKPAKLRPSIVSTVAAVNATSPLSRNKRKDHGSMADLLKSHHIMMSSHSAAADSHLNSNSEKGTATERNKHEPESQTNADSSFDASELINNSNTEDACYRETQNLQKFTRQRSDARRDSLTRDAAQKQAETRLLQLRNREREEVLRKSSPEKLVSIERNCIVPYRTSPMRTAPRIATLLPVKCRIERMPTLIERNNGHQKAGSTT